MNKIIKTALIFISIPLVSFSQTGKVASNVILGVNVKETDKDGKMPLGTKMAVYCKNPNQSVKGKISVVRFYIGEEGIYNAPFKVHIYSLNAADSTPGSDLILDNLIVSADKKGWFEVNVSKYGIDVPANGFFVAMDWIFTKSDYKQDTTKYKSHGEDYTTQGYGQTIGTVTDSPDLGSITYFKTLGGRRWGRFTLPDEKGKTHIINALMQAEVSAE
jgi:hypothetical protein